MLPPRALIPIVAALTIMALFLTPPYLFTSGIASRALFAIAAWFFAVVCAFPAHAWPRALAAGAMLAGCASRASALAIYTSNLTNDQRLIGATLWMTCGYLAVLVTLAVRRPLAPRTRRR